MKKWEYRIVELPRVEALSVEEIPTARAKIVAYLDEMGAEGWEGFDVKFAELEAIMWMKREITPDMASTRATAAGADPFRKRPQDRI